MQGWFDGHPEIGKMQKDVFDDVLDITDDDQTEEDDPAPLIPTPTDFEVDGHQFCQLFNLEAPKLKFLKQTWSTVHFCLLITLLKIV